MQSTLFSVRVIQKHSLFQFGPPLIVEYLEGHYVHRFKVNYIDQHVDLNILISCPFAQNQQATATLAAAFLPQIQAMCL